MKNYASKSIYFFTGKVLWKHNGEFWAEGGFANEIKVMSERLGNVTMVCAYEMRSDMPCGAKSLRLENLTIIPLKASRKIILAPAFVVYYWFMLSRILTKDIVCYSYVPSLTQLGSLAILMCRLRHIPMVIAERGSIVRALTANRRLVFRNVPAYCWQSFWEWLTVRVGYRKYPVFSRGEQRTQELRAMGIDATPLIGGLQQYPPFIGDSIRKRHHFLFVGRLESAKGFWVLLTAFKKLSEKYPKCELELVGRSSHLEEVENFILENKLDGRVICRGLLEFGPELFDAYYRSGAIVLPSFSEGVPNVLLEGMSAGCVAIGSAIPGIMDIIGEYNGILVKPGDENALASVLERFINLPEADYLIMRDNGMKTVNAISRKNTFPLMIGKILAQCETGNGHK